MAPFLHWLNVIQAATEANVIKTTAIISVIIAVGGVVLPMVMKRRSNRWMVEWASEVRTSALALGVTGLLLAWFSASRVVVLGARAWYTVLAVLVLVRAYRLWRRYKHWSEKEKEEYRKLQQLKYIPGR